MTFGGEPLLHPEAVFCAASTAKACGVPKRQVITSGYFTADEGKMEETARRLSESGVNDLLLSVDAFHQEFIPLEVPVFFSRALKKYGVPVRTQPAWLARQTWPSGSFADLAQRVNDTLIHSIIISSPLRVQVIGLAAFFIPFLSPPHQRKQHKKKGLVQKLQQSFFFTGNIRTSNRTPGEVFQSGGRIRYSWYISHLPDPVPYPPHGRLWPHGVQWKIRRHIRFSKGRLR
jgi:hypothetical protein